MGNSVRKIMQVPARQQKLLRTVENQTHRRHKTQAVASASTHQHQHQHYYWSSNSGSSEIFFFYNHKLHVNIAYRGLPVQLILLQGYSRVQYATYFSRTSISLSLLITLFVNTFLSTGCWGRRKPSSYFRSNTRRRF